jgi:hypothetical protein
MSQDRLFLIQPGFQRPDRDPAERFVCPDCNTLEGLLASYPAQAGRQLQVIRVPFERPRQAVVALLSPDQQNLPVLVLGDETEPPPDAQEINGVYFISSCAGITQWLAKRHGFFSL